MLNPKDLKPPKPAKKKPEEEVRHVDKTPAALFFRYNTQLGPPYQVRCVRCHVLLPATGALRAAGQGTAGGAGAVQGVACCRRQLPRRNRYPLDVLRDAPLNPAGAHRHQLHQLFDPQQDRPGQGAFVCGSADAQQAQAAGDRQALLEKCRQRGAPCCTAHPAAATLPRPTRLPARPLAPKQGMMDCLYAECTPMITDCVMAELEKLGTKYRVALKIAKVGRRDC